MSYENAPATHMVATNCAICHRPLLDATSVEIGVGPVCRKKHLGELAEADDEARSAANKLIHDIAVQQDGEDVVEYLKELFSLGFPQVVKAILTTIAKIQIKVTGDAHPHGPNRYAVKSPYDVDAVYAFRNIYGRRWDEESKTNTFPVESKSSIFQLLCEFYEGVTAIGPKGPFIVRCPDNYERGLK